MLDALKFVQGAVSAKDFVPELTHFQIKQGQVKGYNGSITLCAPIALDLDCCPKAKPFVAAVNACNETSRLHLTATGRLSIRTGAFRATVDTLQDPDAYPDMAPEGTRVPLPPGLLGTLRLLYDFSAEDASRPWASGVLLDGAAAYATNNVILVRRELPEALPFRINIPRATVAEMLRIGEDPLEAHTTSTSATFSYSGNRWLRTALNATEWPDVDYMLRSKWNGEPAPLPGEGDELWRAVETLKPFLQETGALYLGEHGAATHSDTEQGACVALSTAPPRCAVNARMLALLEGVATRIDLSKWPEPMVFTGDRLCGVMVGLRDA